MEKIETRLIEKWNRLSPEMQGSLLWIVDHIEFVDRICEGEAMTEKEWKRDMEFSTTREDSLGIALLTYYKHMQNG